jgi:hypothetical protein
MPDVPVPDIPDVAEPAPAQAGPAADAYQARLDAALDEWKARLRDLAEEHKTRADREKEDRDAETALFKSIHDAYIEVAKGSLARAIQRATYITTSAAAIGTVYASLLALLFSAPGKNGGTPVRADALPAAAFLGLSIVLSTAYMAFLQNHARQRDLLPTGIGGDIAQIRLVTFLEWTFSGVVGRAWTLRGAVVSLGLGVLLLPVPFVSLTGLRVGPLHGSAVVVALAVLLLLAWGAGELVLARRRGDYAGPDDVPDPTFAPDGSTAQVPMEPRRRDR